ncbi:hypothetical protein ONR75_02765 [Rhodopseudomonas sp. P2A-2r]|uniref:hypothetical protein n=1 Tax=Rhodopseudomonas sp. P2A-2r TaxID=2991972 RepID=UPI0022346893|nr:hypothetical protein [Rhodopseudomonas sp. P2A-2r]UZE49745.1 hypothetical protein ONR75_02765 [Rhodopseudomonas sp. P2A-2r]
MAASNREPAASAVAFEIPSQIAAQSDVTHPRIALPEGVRPWRVDWVNTVTIASFHALALLALLPTFFN